MEKNCGLIVLYVRLGRNNDKRDSQSLAQEACSRCTGRVSWVAALWPNFSFSGSRSVSNKSNAWNN